MYTNSTITLVLFITVLIIAAQANQEYKRNNVRNSTALSLTGLSILYLINLVFK
jgi:hypothetical protein